MIHFTEGNLLDARVDALVNTVNTVGVMGKGVALMFKEAFPANFKAYRAACQRGEVQVGRMFITEGPRMAGGPKWIINFPTKKHWRGKTKIEWIDHGLDDLVHVVRERGIQSIAIPPLGCGNGGLEWSNVRPLIESKLRQLDQVEVTIFEPTREYQNVAKRTGVEELTTARALVAEMVRRYWVLGIECSLLEIQKLAWLLERRIERSGAPDPLKLDFQTNRYGPYADRLRHLLEQLDGSYLRSEIRIADAKATDVIAFNDEKKDWVEMYLKSESRPYLEALDEVSQLIDGFESPLGMELLSTLDWLLSQGEAEPNLPSVKAALAQWNGGGAAADRKLKLFDDRSITLALHRLSEAA